MKSKLLCEPSCSLWLGNNVATRLSHSHMTFWQISVNWNSSVRAKQSVRVLLQLIPMNNRLLIVHFYVFDTYKSRLDILTPVLWSAKHRQKNSSIWWICRGLSPKWLWGWWGQAVQAVLDNSPRNLRNCTEESAPRKKLMMIITEINDHLLILFFIYHSIELVKSFLSKVKPIKTVEWQWSWDLEVEENVRDEDGRKEKMLFSYPGQGLINRCVT